MTNTIQTEKELRDNLQAELAEIGSQKDYMTLPQVNAFRTFLVGLAKVLDARAADIKQQIRENKPDGADEADAAQAQSDLESNYQREFAIAQQQKNVRAAFESMRNDEYGYCVDCGAEIGMERMIAMPWSIRDADCATLFELKMQQNTGRRAA